MNPLSERPPYVEFAQRPMERRSSSGEIEYFTVNFALITPHGSKDRVERVAEDWIENCKQQAKAGRMDPEWVRQFEGAYKEWKATGEIPVEGTPLANWPVLTAGERKRCLDLKLRAVEDLAAANEETIQRLGMGGRSLKQRARDWIEGQKGTGSLVNQLEAQRQTIAQQANRIEALEKQISGFLAAGTQPASVLVGQQVVQLEPVGGPTDDELVDGTIEALMR